MDNIAEIFIGVILWIIAIAVVLVALHLVAPAKAHSWYSEQKSPTGVRCCGGTDCFEVPWAWLSEDADNYIVTLPNPVPVVAGLAGSYYKPGSYKFPKSEALPTPSTVYPDDGKEHSGYHACIWGGKGRCFFAPLGY